MGVMAKCVPNQVTTHLHDLLAFSLKEMSAARNFKKKGDVKFRISKNKKAVYYHPNANYLAQKRGLPREFLMSLCRSFANPDVAYSVRDKCRCRFFAVIKMSLLHKICAMQSVISIIYYCSCS